MKKLFIILAFGGLGIIASCGGDADKKADTETAKEGASAEPEVEAENPDYEKGLALVGQSDCLTCHKVNEALVGPAYQAVADRYEKTDAVIDTLANKIITGGSGRWGAVPMTPHPNVSKEDAVAMVKYVFSLKK